MLVLLLAAASFVALHLMVSGTPLRQALVSRLGEGPFRGLFSLLSLGTLVWLVMSYSRAPASPELVTLGHWSLLQTTPVTFIAFLMIVVGYLTPNPTSVGQEGFVAGGREPVGIQRITRHPFLWGVMLWSASHLLANRTAVDWLFFGAFLIVAAAGTVSIDAKRRRALGDAWQRYAAHTSNVPFLAIAQGRTSFNLREIGWRPLAAAVVFAAFYLGHGALFGAPLPPPH